MAQGPARVSAQASQAQALHEPRRLPHLHPRGARSASRTAESSDSFSAAAARPAAHWVRAVCPRGQESRLRSVTLCPDPRVRRPCWLCKSRGKLFLAASRGEADGVPVWLHGLQGPLSCHCASFLWNLCLLLPTCGWQRAGPGNPGCRPHSESVPLWQLPSPHREEREVQGLGHGTFGAYGPTAAHLTPDTCEPPRFPTRPPSLAQPVLSICTAIVIVLPSSLPACAPGSYRVPWGRSCPPCNAPAHPPHSDLPQVGNRPVFCT